MEKTEHRRLCSGLQLYHSKWCKSLQIQVMELIDRHDDAKAWEVLQSRLVRSFCYAIHHLSGEHHSRALSLVDNGSVEQLFYWIVHVV